MHHIVSDGWSVGVLYASWARCTPLVHGQGDRPAAAVQYADYAVWHRRWVEGPVLEAQRSTAPTLAGAPGCWSCPPTTRPAKAGLRGSTVNVELDEVMTRGAQAASQRHGTTLS